MRDVLSMILRHVRPLQTQIVNLIARGVLKRATDSSKLQLVQVDVLDGETRDGIERVQNYGFSSVPEPGADVVVVFAGGQRDHGLAIAADDRRYRIRNLESGEVAVYDKAGSSIVLKASGDIEVTPASGVVKFIGDAEIDGISFLEHTHPGSSLSTNATVGTSSPATISGSTGVPE